MKYERTLLGQDGMHEREKARNFIERKNKSIFESSSLPTFHVKNNRTARNERLTVDVAKCYVKTHNRWTTAGVLRNNEGKALFDSENVEDGTEFSSVHGRFLCKSNTILATCKGHSLTLLKTIV